MEFLRTTRVEARNRLFAKETAAALVMTPLMKLRLETGFDVFAIIFMSTICDIHDPPV